MIRRQTTTGFALSSRTFAAASVRRHGQQAVLDHFSCVESSDDAMMTEDLADSLTAFLQTLGNTRKLGRVMAGFSNPQAVLRVLSMPSMPGGEMRHAIATELEDYAVLAGAMPIFDFHTLPSTMGDPGSQLLVGAVPEGFGQNYYRLLRDAGISPAGLDLNHLAAMRAVLDTNRLTAEHVPLMLLLVGAEVSYAVGFHEGELFFLHPMDIGSQRLWSDADAGLDELLHEFQLCWNYYHADFPEAGAFDHVMVVLDAPHPQTVCDRLQETFHIDTVELGNPGIHLADPNGLLVGIEQQLFSTSAAVGLALRDHPPQAFRATLNLLPQRVLSLARLRPLLAQTGLAVAAALVLLATVNIYYNAQLSDAARRSERVEMQIEQIESMRLQPVLELKRQVGQLERRLDSYEQFLGDHRSRHRSYLLAWLGESMPTGVWLSRLSCDALNNVVFTGHSASQETAFQFLDRVRHTPFFTAPQFSLQRATPGDEGSITFTLRCKLERGETDGSAQSAS